VTAKATEYAMIHFSYWSLRIGSILLWPFYCNENTHIERLGILLGLGQWYGSPRAAGIFSISSGYG